MHGEFPASYADVPGLLDAVGPWTHDGHGDDGRLLDQPPAPAYTFITVTGDGFIIEAP